MAEKVDIFMPLFVADYLADTTDLTAEEHGAYLLLLMASWRQGGVLENNPQRLARMAKVPPERWPAVWEAIERFFDVDGNTVSQGRLVEELERAREQKAAASERGRRGAAARHHAGAVLKHNSGTAQAREQACSPPSPSPKDGGSPAPACDPLGPEPVRGHEVIGGYELSRLFGRVRAEVVGGHEWQGAGANAQKAANLAAHVSATQGWGQTVSESIRRFWLAVKAGDHPMAEEAAKSLPRAFAIWGSQFPTDHEAILGIAPPLTPPKNGGARATGPPRDVRFGHARAEDSKHTTTGEVKL